MINIFINNKISRILLLVIYVAVICVLAILLLSGCSGDASGDQSYIVPTFSQGNVLYSGEIMMKLKLAS